jgi:hypothetical protein
MLTGDKKRARLGKAACRRYADDVGADMDEDQGVIMQDLVVSILHLCDQEGMDPFTFSQKALRKFEETLVEEDY